MPNPLFPVRIASVALLAIVAASGANAAKPQAHTIIVKPTGDGSYKLIVGGAVTAPTDPLAGGLALPGDFSVAGGCDLTADAEPIAYVKGGGAVEGYTVMCASSGSDTATGPVVNEALASLHKVRDMVAAQQKPPLTEAERAHALGVIDASLHDLESELGTAG